MYVYLEEKDMKVWKEFGKKGAEELGWEKAMSGEKQLRSMLCLCELSDNKEIKM